jgi:hypothetical protein
MLFLISWKPRPGSGSPEQELGLEIYKTWKPPDGMQIRGMWGRVDGGAFCIAEVETAEVLLEALAPWAGTLLDFDTCPIVEMQRGVELAHKGMALRASARVNLTGRPRP